MKQVPRRRWLRPLAAMVTTGAVAVGAMLVSTSAASAATTTLAPASMATTAGATGSGQTVANLKTRDLSGSTDTWAKYVEFSGTYTGTRSYTLPSSVAPSSVTGIEVHVNYRGPASSTQTWTWSLKKAGTTTFTTVGTNSGAPSWGAWKELVLPTPASAKDYVAADGTIVVQLKSNNASDAADVDWESLTITSTAATTPPTTTPTPTATPTPTPTTPAGSYTKPSALWKFDYQLGGGYTPAAGVKMVDRDRTDSPLAGVYSVCYVNLFQTQPGSGEGSTAWWIANHPNVMLKNASGKVLYDKGWPDEALFDTRTAAQRTELMSVFTPWLQKCASDGFKAVEADNLDSYTRDVVTQPGAGAATNPMAGSSAGNMAFLKLAVDVAHNAGMAFAQKNSAEQIAQAKANGTDFVISEDCGAFAGDCQSYFDGYRVGSTQTALVFDVEYIDNPDAKGGYSKACSAWAGKFSIIEREEDLIPNGHYATCSGS